MAEINIEPKKSKPVWPWILALIAVIILIWVLINVFGKNTNNNPPTEGNHNDTISRLIVPGHNQNIILT